MAIIVDPDALTRNDVIFGTASQTISIYPIGDTERNGVGVEYTDVYVTTTGEVTTGLGSFAAAQPGDVMAIQNNLDAGHYYVRTETTPAITLADIDTGTGGAETTGLNVQTSAAWDGTSDLDDTTERITLTGHGYVTGDAVVYDRAGGTLVTGLTDLTVYYIIRFDANTVELALNYANAVAGTNIDLTDTGTSANNVFHDRLIVTIFNNGANTSENILGLDTSGDGDGDVADGITLQAIYSFGKEEWRIDSQIADVASNSYNDDLIRHQFPFETITSEQFETGGGTSHDNWNWFNQYTRKKVRTAGWAEKTDVGTGDLARETGIITLGNIDTDAQVYYQQTSVVTPKADFTFLGPVNEALNVYADASADNTPEDDFTTFLKLFVRKKGRSYSGSQISDIGVTTIQTIVNRFPLAHATDTGITLGDANLKGATPYSFATAPVNIATTGTQNDGVTATSTTFTSAGAAFTTDGVIPGDILEITSGSDIGFYRVGSVAATVLTIDLFETVAAPTFTFNAAFTAGESSLTYAVYSSILTPTPGETGVRDDGTKAAFPVVADTGIVDVDTATGTLTDTSGTFTADGIATGDIVLIEKAFEVSFASASVPVTATDLFTIASHPFSTGDRVQYDINGGTVIGGLTDQVIYYISVASSSTFYLCLTLDDAWDRANGDATDIDITGLGVGTHIFHAYELAGAYPVVSNDSANQLTLDTTDNPFPAVVQANTSYTVVEAGMYLQYKDKTINKHTFTQATTPLTNIEFTASTIILTGPSWSTGLQAGDMIVIEDIVEAGTLANNGRFTVLSRDSGSTITVLETGAFVVDATVVAGTIYERQGFERTLGADDVSFNWKISGNGGSLQNVFEVIQEQLRSTADIDAGAGTFTPSGATALVGFVGNINDLLMTFASPTGTGLNLFIDGLDANDINNSTYNDHGGTARNFPFTSAGSLVFNPNLTNDQNSKYWLFFTNDDAPGDNLGRDYGTENAIIVEDATTPTANPITGFVNASGGATHGGTRSVSAGTTSITFTYAYDTNVQRGSGSGASTAPVTLVAIGAPVGQFVIATGNITNTTGITISAVASLERNYNGALTAS